jgi:hypothetical protein
LAQQRSAQESDTLCAAAAKSRKIPAVSCRSLATAIVTRATERFYRPDPRDIQNPAPRPGTGGSLAQSEAVPGVEPLAVGGASISAVGTDSGARSVVAITINPAVFFVSPSDAEAMASASRIADLSLLLPVDDLDRDHDGRVDYIGMRLRLNLTGSGSGKKVREAARAFLRAVQGEADMVNDVLAALQRARDLDACVTTLVSTRSSAALVTRRCDGAVDLEADAEVYEEMKTRMREAREEADSRYFGLDLRADLGDPTLSGLVPAKTRSLTAGLAAGRRILSGQTGGPSAGFKARAGLRYVGLPDSGPTSFAFDGGLGFELERPMEGQGPLTASAGLEWRYGGESANETSLQTNFTVFRFSLNVPVAGGAGVSVGVSAPIDGQVSPTLTVSFNWSLLLPKNR